MKKLAYLMAFCLILVLISIKSVQSFDERIEKILNQNTLWIINQYGNNDRSQLMCYTIEGNRNGLVIVDGGFEDDEETLKILENTIKKHNNKVDAWILTHFDTDHAGAFMAIYNKNKDLELGKLYVQDTPDLETCKSKATWYDGWDLYERYLNLNIFQKTFLHTGDEINDIIGLRLEVLCAYDNWIGEEMENLLNNGSIVFKLYGNKEAIMFCGDVQDKKIGEFLVNKYGGRLSSDYLQVPHHGNNSLGEEFYKLVNPRIAFFPAPEWIMKNTNNVDWFTAPQIWEFLRNRGVKTYYFRNSPAKIIMK